MRKSWVASRPATRPAPSYQDEHSASSAKDAPVDDPDKPDCAATRSISRCVPAPRRRYNRGKEAA